MELDWDIALAVLSLPDTCAAQEPFKHIIAVAAECLQQRLGDLDCVWADQQLTQQLLALPAAALKQLLPHDSTCMVAENTAAYTVLRWFKAQQGLTAEAAAHLFVLQLVRMRHCTHLYVSTVLSHSALFCASFSTPEATVTAACCVKSSYKALCVSNCPLLHKYPAWTMRQRPNLQQSQVIKWQLPLDQLRPVVEDAPGAQAANHISTELQ